MLGTYYYHEIIRKTVIGFGTLFNNINIRHKDGDGKSYSTMKVPLAYGPMQKFLARIQQQPNLERETAITVPRISFEMTGLQYDATRKASVTQTFMAKSGTAAKKVYMPVPYNIQFELSVLSKLQDDSLQIIEQILPYFQPSFNITINLLSSIGEKKDVPIVLECNTQTDYYEGSYESRRIIIHTLSFTAKTYLFGAIADSTAGLIKKVDVDYFADTEVKRAVRVQRYSAAPKALKDYDNDETTVVDGAISTAVTKIKLSATSDISTGDRIIIDQEIMYVRTNDTAAATLTVYRAYDNTSRAKHEHNATVNILSSADDLLIETGDDFGFDEMTSFFQDGKVAAPSQGIDV